MHRTGEVAGAGEMPGRAEQQGRVPVMAAGMHLAGKFRLVGTLRLLRHGERVHVGAKADGPRAVADLQGADHARLAQAPMHAKAGLLQQGGDDAARPLLFETQLRMGMQVLAEAAQEW